MKRKRKPITRDLVPQEVIENKILLLRGKKVMLDRDLAQLYDVTTKVLNQAVKRNIERFPQDLFMLQLTSDEKTELVTNCDRFKSLKHSSTLPYAFTEQGVSMVRRGTDQEIAIRDSWSSRKYFKVTQLQSVLPFINSQSKS